jgi:hypothetical protein
MFSQAEKDNFYGFKFFCKTIHSQDAESPPIRFGPIVLKSAPVEA